MGKTLGYGEITVANMTEPFTVMLTNEAQQFATDSNRKVTSAQSYYTDIIVIRGSQERTDYTIGNITSGSGITVSKNSKRVTFSVSAGTTIGADAGVIEIPITLDGQTVKKQFSWSCGKQGPQGVKGNDGNSFAWNMLSETNCGKKHWGTESSGGKYSVEDFITEDNIDAVKLICTEAISTSNWSFVSFKDIKMLKQLKPSTKYTLSYDIKANRSGAISHSICKGDVSNFCTNTVVVNNIIGNETWQHISVVLTTNDLKTTPTNEILYLGRNALSKVGYSIIKNLKLVEGDIDTPWSPSQSDIEGKGVVETVQYYLATSQASGVTSSTSGWSTDITTQKLTADKKYLWNCYQTKYSDGTSEPISTPKVIGVYGDKGQKGENAKNLSITPSSQYFKSTDGGKTFAPDTIAIKPTIQGEISFGKWQYSIDGGVSFADVVSGQKGLTISNNVLTVNKDSSLYSDAVTMVTFRAVANDSSFYDTCSIAKIYDVSDIGDGRNLIQKSQLNPIDGAELSLDDYTKNGTVIFTNKSENSGFSFDSYNNYQPNSKYVLSYYFTKTSGTMNSFGGSHNGKGVVYTSFFVDDKVYDTASYAGGSSQIGTILNDGKRHRIVVCYTTPDTIATDTSVNYTFIQPGRGNTNPNFGVKIEELKLEKGSSPTGWSPAPEDLQTAILSTKSEISDVSLKVDNNKQAIEQRVEKTTYQQDLKLVKGDMSKANEGLNKWRYEIYPKSLFTDKPEDQRKISLDVFARNKNIIPTQSILLDDTKLGYFNYDDNYIGYAVTFVKMSEATKLETTFVHDDAGSFYLNGKLICTNGTNNFYSSATPDTVSCTLVKGWNCLEVVINEGAGSEGFKFGTVLSQLSTCQLMNCYYAMVTGRESQITNTLVQNTIDIEGVSTKVGKVTSVIGDNGENFTSFKNDYSDFKQTMNGFKTTVGQTYVTKDDFNGLEIGGRNLARDTSNEYSTPYTNFNGSTNTCFYDKRVYLNGLKAGDTITVHMYVKYDDVVPTSGQTARMWIQGSGNVTVWNSGTFPGSSRQSLSGSSVCEILYSATVYKDSEKNQYWDCCIRTDYIQSGSVQVKSFKVEKGNKATDWTPAPEDNEVNGQNLASNLPSSWEQGTVTEGSAVGTTYANTKSASAGSIRPKELIPVSGYITISTAYSNQSQKPIRHWIAAYDVNKNYLGVNYVSNSWNSFPRTLDMKDAKYLAIMVGYTDSSAITPSDISKICLKIERGTSATQFTLAPEDVNGKIQSVETIATQTADKFSWLVKSGTSSSNFELTDKTATLVADKINMDGLVTFNGLDSSARDRINTVTSGNLITVTPANPKSDYGGGQTYNVIADDKGGRCVQWNSSCASFLLLNSYTPVNFTSSDQLYYDIRVPNWSSTTFDTKLTIWFYNKNKALITSASKTLTLKSTIWNHFTGYLTLPSSSNWGDLYYYIIGLTNPNKQAIGFTNDSYIEKVNSYATAYAKNAVDWVGQNGTNTNNMYNMVSKWTDGAVSDTTQINGGWIKTNTITANKIAIGDFTNYADINESNTYWFRAEQTKEGTWFYRDGSELQRDNVISELHTCRGGEKFYVEYDISNTIKEGDEYKYAGLMIFGYDGNGGIVSYNRNAGVTATANGEITHITTQLTMPDTTRSFRVYLQIEGHVPFTGTLKIRNISVRKAVTGNLIVDGAITADKIATDAIKSRNYISSGGTQGSFLNLSDGSFKSPNLSWDSNGNLIAKNANLSGQITATKGTVGGWNIDNYSIYTTYDANQNIFGAGISGTKGKYVLWAGETNDAIGANRSSNVPTDASLVIYNNGGLEVRKSMVGNDKKNHLYTTILQSGQINLKMDDDYIGTITATDTISSNSTVTMRHVSMAAKNGYGWSILHTNESGSLISDMQRDPGDTKIKINSPITVFSTDITKYNAIETTGDVVVSGKIHANYGSNKIQLNPDNNGSIELYGYTPFIDFHYGNSDSDYTSRIIAQEWGLQIVGTATVTGDLYCDAHIYTCTNGHFSWAGQTDAYLGCGNYSGGNNIYYYANYHAFYVNNDSGSGMMYINTNGVTSRVGFTKTSDERIKKNFESFDDNIIDAYMNIEPVKYQLKQSSNDNYHFGFKAQHVDKVFSDYGDTYNESFDICTSRPIDPDKAKELYGVDGMTEEYGLRYDELIAPTTYMVQHTYKELESTKDELSKVKQEKENLESRLQAIEAKLGL